MSKNTRSLNIKDYLMLNPMDLANILTDTFLFDVPFEIETEEELKEVGKMLALTSNQYSFLTSLLSYAKIQTREAKRLGIKITYEDAIDRKEIIQNITEAVKLRHKTLSRLITVKQERNSEIFMSERRIF